MSEPLVTLTIIQCGEPEFVVTPEMEATWRRMFDDYLGHLSAAERKKLGKGLLSSLTPH